MTADRLFVRAPEVAEALGIDVRTVRRSIAAGDIPSKKYQGAVLIPAEWLREQAAPPPSASPEPRLSADELADLVAERVVARLTRTLLGMHEAGS
jgi:hypothetical protein